MVTHLTGIIQTTDILTQRCPNISNLALYSVHGGRSGFTVLLHDLVALLIEQGDYEICDTQGAVQGVGQRLEEELQLHEVHNVMFYFILIFFIVIFIFSNKF